MKNEEWGRNVQIRSLQPSTVFVICFPIFPVMLLLVCPSGVRSCVSCPLAMLFSNAYKIMTGGIVGSCGSFPSLCCRDPRNSGCLPPDSASDPTLRANQLLSYYKPRGKVCSTLTATRNCCSECKAFTVDLLWVDVSVFHVYD